jgi:hypothetical protein
MTYYDRRTVRVFDSGGTMVYEAAMVPLGGTIPPLFAPPNPTAYTPLSYHTCSQMGEWHTHYFQMDASWPMPVTVVFGFDSIDGVNNMHSGWALDDIAVGAASGGGAPGGSGPGGTTRENSNGDKSGNDVFGKNWCGAGSMGSGLGIALVLGLMLMLLGSRR